MVTWAKTGLGLGIRFVVEKKYVIATQGSSFSAL